MVFEVCVGRLALLVALISLMLPLCLCSSRRGPNPTEHDAEALIDDPIRRGSMSHSDLSSGVWSRVELYNRVNILIQPVVV